MTYDFPKLTLLPGVIDTHVHFNYHSNRFKKGKDEMHPEYKRSDSPKLERGKFYAEATAGTYVVILDPVIAKAFPTSKAKASRTA